MQAFRKIRKWIKQHPALRLKMRRCIDITRKAYRRAVMGVMARCCKIDPQKVVFSSFWGRSYNDNPRYISEKLHELAPELKQVWLFKKFSIDKAQTPDYVKKALSGGWQEMYELATARVWVDNLKKSQSFLYRPDKQIYFNTWHGDRGFKRVGKDNKYIPYRPRTERLCDAMIAGSEFGARNYRTAFEFEGTVLMDGCPRNDILLRNDPQEARVLRERMKLPQDAKLLIYAPTYRDIPKGETQPAELNLTRTLDCLEAHTGDKWLCLTRAHFLDTEFSGKGKDERIINMTAWPEMAEILLVSDMLITDYSSCAGDFILRDKPAILYQSDIADYEHADREMYFDMRTSPFFIAHDMKELEDIIDGLTEEKVVENCRQWREFFGVTETGHASEASARFILKTMAQKR